MDRLSRRAFLRSGQASAAQRPPPWTGDSFIDLCTRCGDCLQACPEGILFKGDGGFPQIRFLGEGCTFCGKCANACSEQVFDLAREAFTWKASVKETCLTHANIHCQTCQDICEPRAITFRPQLNHVPEPEVNENACNGCGACLAVCPQDAIALEIPQTSEVTHAE